jgi:ATP-dependent helicase Lhr and Lhr-like helicase
MCESIGFDLSDRLLIGRTSSQDTGVDRDADITVATASLEVGFNHPGVGAVLRHKAPRGTASFLQRRGRAGRVRTMRPWTVVVLSDYGRDRAAYQAYEQLFDPVLDARALPVGNRYVLRMQAVYVLMDWLRTQLLREPAGSVWGDLAGPPVRERPDGGEPPPTAAGDHGRARAAAGTGPDVARRLRPLPAAGTRRT